MHSPMYYIRFYGSLFAKHLKNACPGGSDATRAVLDGFATAIENMFKELDENAKKKLGL